MAYQIINPATGKIEQTFEPADNQIIEAALNRSATYYRTQRQVTFQQRAAQLAEIAQIFRDHVAQLASVAATNMGKRYQEGIGEATAAANIAQYYVDHGLTALTARQYTYLDGKKAVLQYEATGTVLAVEPWNFPYTQVMRVFAPNFLLGNPVILKHARIVAGCADLFEQLVWAANVDHGAFQNLFINSEQVATMIADARIQGVALTGSAQAGSAVAAEAGRAMKKSTLELGGNDAFIVLKGADIDQAVLDGATSRLRNAGQVCTSAKRFIVECDVAEVFTTGMIAQFRQRQLGDPLDETTTLAPMASKAMQLNLQHQVDVAVENGAQVLVAGGAVLDRPGNFFKPVLLTNLTPDNPMYDEEFFGPVGQIHVVDNEAAAISLANRSQFGLAGAVYAKTVTAAKRVADQLETGQIFLNQPSNGYPELPFGGVKNSGYGREMSDLALYEFANQKMIALG